MRKSKGPSTDPCGTPCLVIFHEEDSLFALFSLITVLWYLLPRQDCIILYAVLCRKSKFNQFLTCFCILMKFGIPSGVRLIKSKYYACTQSVWGNSICMLKTNKYMVPLYKIYLPHAHPSCRLASDHVLLHFLSVFLKDFWLSLSLYLISERSVNECGSLVE